jgi:hypothetical protein
MKQKVALGLTALLLLATLAITAHASWTITEGVDGYVYGNGTPVQGIVVRVYNVTSGELEGYGVIPGAPPTKGELGTDITDESGYFHIAWLYGYGVTYKVVAETPVGDIIEYVQVYCGSTTRVNFCYYYCYTIGYWKNHLEDWPVTSLTIGGVTYDQNGLLSILWNANAKDATYMLAAQLIGAKLNVANGVDSSAISGTITEADNFLSANPLGSNPQKAYRDYALTLKDALDDFNNGY